jgi:A/G-specific adenine glycosylase
MIPDKKFSALLLAWYDQQGRKNLPWREKITPYRVWISEIMLQQTQVKTVLPYFQRFIVRFPTISDLATANEDEVLSLWTGLGYYARARNLHKTAKQIITHYKGEFPKTLEEIQALPGIGRSTASAILAIAFGKKAAILDGNVKRVLTRLHTLEKTTSENKFLQQLWRLAEQYTPEKRAADYTQAIMDLGAMVCTRTQPRCRICPISSHCKACLQHRQAEFPTVKTKKDIPTRAVNFLIFHDKALNRVLLQKRPPMGIWGGLWSFPECPGETDIVKWCAKNLNCLVKNPQPLSTFKHVFSHFQLNITPIYIANFSSKQTIMESQQQVWYPLKKTADRGFASPVKRLLEYFMALPSTEETNQ